MVLFPLHSAVDRGNGKYNHQSTFASCEVDLGTGNRLSKQTINRIIMIRLFLETDFDQDRVSNNKTISWYQ